MKMKKPIAIIKIAYRSLPKSWMFRTWLLSMLIFFISYPLRLLGFLSDQFQTVSYMGVLITGIIGIFSFCLWCLSMIFRLLFGKRSIALKDLAKSGVITLIFGCIVILFFLFIPSKSHEELAEETQTNASNAAMSRVYVFDDEYPNESVYMQDLTISDDPRRFHAYIFDKDLKFISTTNKSELKIEKNNTVSFKFYGNNAYREQLLNSASNDQTYKEEIISYRNTNFEKQVRVFSSSSDTKHTLHYLFIYGGYDYLITAEWDLNNDEYRSLSDKLIATLAPTTVKKDFADQFNMLTASNDKSETKAIESSSLPTPSPSLPHTSLCFVDKNGKFDIFFTECQAMANQDKEGFKQRAIEICIDGKSPAMSFKDATTEFKEKKCKEYFSEDPFPIALNPKQ